MAYSISPTKELEEFIDAELEKLDDEVVSTYYDVNDGAVIVGETVLITVYADPSGEGYVTDRHHLS